MRPSVDDLGYAQTVWDYMFLRHDPVPSDIIIGLGSHDLTVADDVAELYARGMAPIVVFSGNVGRLTEGRFDQSEAKMMQDRARLSGVPDSAMLLEEESTNTGENLRLTQRLLREAGVQARSVIVVPSLTCSGGTTRPFISSGRKQRRQASYVGRVAFPCESTWNRRHLMRMKPSR